MLLPIILSALPLSFFFSRKRAVPNKRTARKNFSLLLNGDVVCHTIHIRIERLGHLKRLVDGGSENAGVPIADDAAFGSVDQLFHGKVAHAGCHDTVTGGRRAAALDVAQDGDTGFEPRLFGDALGDLLALADALRHDDEVVVLVTHSAHADLLDDVPFKVERKLRRNDGGRTDGKADVNGEMACVPSHDLYDGHALM